MIQPDLPSDLSDTDEVRAAQCRLPRAMKLPNFFIVGAPKAGTTSLYEYLGQHPRVYVSPLKEPYYFASEVRAEHFSEEERPRIERELRSLAEYLRGDLRAKRFGGLVSSWEDYLKLFGNVSEEIAIGEATPHYLWSESAPGNIAARIPRARIIISLRNPVERAFSDYLHMLSVGAIRRSFREQIEANLRCTSKRIGLDWPFLEYGHYHEQLLRYFRVFPREQIHISFYEDLERAPQALIAELYTFLGVDAFHADLSQRHNEPRVPRSGWAASLLKAYARMPHLLQFAPASLRPRLRSLVLRPRASLRMLPADRTFLIDYYRDEIGKLAALLDRDLSAWLKGS
jgi:hypothetical protein